MAVRGFCILVGVTAAWSNGVPKGGGVPKSRGRAKMFLIGETKVRGRSKRFRESWLFRIKTINST